MRKTFVAALSYTAAALLALTTGTLSAQAEQISEPINNNPAISPRIVGGTNAVQGEFPFATSIQDNGRHFCGGSLIDQQTILTAEHCVSDLTSDTLINNTTVTVGSHNIVDKSLGQTRKIAKIVSKESNDTALITLDRAIEDIIPVQLPEPGATAQVGDATAIGWGRTQAWNAVSPSILQKVTAPIMPLSQCKALWGDEVTDADICAGIRGASVCMGDSGGPLLVEKNGQLVQLGVVSRGEAVCGDRGKPGIFASTSAPGFLDGMTQIYPRL
ncbi:serine protease [Lysinibacter sp. HNR]|uniref:S1 family peptidase n=1 Tax=Lysinibacter sp. HNR TaxID=3031408 RepID=UPI0024358AA8|nr:serine protease [Lysinibacter sp. HNR]WGD37640.1 serine protease [Lysinibacter sp. HNR]